MIKIYPDSSRFAGDRGWLRSRFSFSFGDYYDETNTEFGALRVFNDDIIQGGHGFGAHPHREMEIVSVVLKGQLKHEDNTGHTAVTGFGGVQRMSAGTGIIHSEVNPSDEECRLLQIWFTPGESKLPPSYETTSYDPAAMKNALLPIVSHQSSIHVAHIHQDLTMYLSQLDPGQSLRFQQPEGRRIYLFVIEGGLLLEGSIQLEEQDSARITEQPELTMESESGAMFMLIDLP
ncbi:pirin family protein [Paenibacillus mendelii]|uniref:Pirin family protein n=1 Tax=Paenibacillus mendelii TaxID=206163 RepID=A0ABV6JJN6_9BACL|nr:pirin-like bicupin family protein [Paenibacillus mendelii]MCQ6559051.1 pirin family protein [Paenibacillus mendelii]